MENSGFDHITKRAALVSDTLLLSHTGAAPAHRLSTLSHRRTSGPRGARMVTVGDREGAGGIEYMDTYEFLSMRCPDITALGTWLTEAEPLLRAGLAWYLPRYAVTRQTSLLSPDSVQTHHPMPVASALDFLVQSGRAVSESSVCPPHALKSAVVRPVLTMDLPFLEGVRMADFSRITVEEFESYKAFQSLLRQEFLSLDTALNAVESERELIKIAHRIEDEARGIRSQMTAVRRKRAVAVSGAVVGTIGASLVAVYGPAFQTAVAALGAAGASGIWGIIQSAADNSPRTLRDSPWFYVWILARNSERYQ